MVKQLKFNVSHCVRERVTLRDATHLTKGHPSDDV